MNCVERGKALRAERDAEIQELANRGLTCVQIAKRFHISNSRVGQIIKKYEIEEAVCLYCAKIFTKTKSRQKYCTKKCGAYNRNGIIQPHLREQSRLAKITSKIAPPDKNGCWDWQGRIKPRSGYGIINWGGKSEYAHRWVWARVMGRIPDGLFVLHRCDRPKCVNPKHLFLGTAADNAKDRDAKGRHNKPNRFKPNQIAAIRTFYKSPSDCTWLAKIYGVHPTTIYSIAKGRSYAT